MKRKREISSINLDECLCKIKGEGWLLDLSGKNLNEQDIINIIDIFRNKLIVSLSLSNSSLPKKAVIRLIDAGNYVECINLSSTIIDDEIIAILLEANKEFITELELSHTHISNKAITYLCQFPNLEKLAIYDTTIDEEGINLILKSHPHLKLEATLPIYQAKHLFSLRSCASSGPKF